MAAKMTVLSLTQTGHIVAALAEPPSGPAALAALVGAAFPLRTPRRRGAAVVDTSFALPAAILALKSLAYDSRVIARPQSFAVNGDLVAELPAIPPPTVGGLDANAVTANYGPAVAAETKVLVVVRDEADPRVQRIQAGTIAAAAASVALNLAIVPGGPAAGLNSADYLLMVAAEGKPLGYAAATIP